MDFSRYLNGLPYEQLVLVYQSPWTCLALLRSLPSLSQQLVLRLLFVDEAIPDSLLRGFIKPEYTETCCKSLEVLKQLQVVQKKGNNCWTLDPAFR
jgi:transcription initiation factor TFIIH subunit 4